MKKIISLILVLSFVFTLSLCLISCGGANTPSNTENEENGNTENAGGEENGGNEGGNEVVLSPYEITSETWDSVLASKNYTVLSTTSKKTTTYKANGEALMVETPSNGTTYYVIEDGKTYRVSNGTGVKVNQGIALKDMVFKSLANQFSNLVYNEETNEYTLSYTAGDITTNGDYTFKFENGVLLSATYKQGVTKTTLEFSDFGTTEVEVPEFEKPSW